MKSYLVWIIIGLLAVGAVVSIVQHNAESSVSAADGSGDLCPFTLVIRGVPRVVWFPCPPDPGDCPIWNPVTGEFDWGPCP